MQEPLVLVVGGLTGIGRGVVEAVGEARCVVWSRRTGVDATDEASVQRAAAALLRGGGAPWAWVHAMGDFDERPALATDLGAYRTMLDSNLTSAWVVMRAILPAMQAAGRGRVVFFGASGLDGQRGMRRAPAYFAAKAGLLALMRALARDMAPHGVTVNMVSPGIIAHPHSHTESQTRMAPKVPKGRVGAPTDVAALVRFLLAPESDYVTGTNIDVDGGLALG